MCTSTAPARCQNPEANHFVPINRYQPPRIRRCGCADERHPPVRRTPAVVATAQEHLSRRRATASGSAGSRWPGQASILVKGTRLRQSPCLQDTGITQCFIRIRHATHHLYTEHDCTPSRYEAVVYIYPERKTVTSVVKCAQTRAMAVTSSSTSSNPSLALHVNRKSPIPIRQLLRHWL